MFALKCIRQLYTPFRCNNLFVLFSFLLFCFPSGCFCCWSVVYVRLARHRSFSSSLYAQALYVPTTHTTHTHTMEIKCRIIVALQPQGVFARYSTQAESLFDSKRIVVSCRVPTKSNELSRSGDRVCVCVLCIRCTQWIGKMEMVQ